MEKAMQLVVDRRGTISGVYGEAIDLACLGDVSIQRASHVEPDAQGRWWADLSPVGGPKKLGPFGRRSEALMAEMAWLEDHRCGGADAVSPSIPTKPEDRPWD
jgi:hypothetical protein